jgi:hypothetical protein
VLPYGLIDPRRMALVSSYLRNPNFSVLVVLLFGVGWERKRARVSIS